MVQRVSEKCKYKTYLSPEGKSFRSLAGVYRYIEQVQNGEVPIKGSRRPRGPYGQQNRHSSTTSISSSTTSSSSSSSSSVVSLRKNGGATSSGYGDALLTSVSSMPYGYNATANAQGYLFHDTGHVTTDQNQRLGCVHTGHVYETDRHESLLQFLSQILRPDMQKTDSNRLARLLELQAANTDPAEKTMVFTHAACFGHRPCNGSLESPGTLTLSPTHHHCHVCARLYACVCRHIYIYTCVCVCTPISVYRPRQESSGGHCR
jgi:hypothetical protein